MMSDYHRRIPNHVIAVLLLEFLLSAPGFAADFDRGRALYENHCQTCHEDWAHSRGNRKVATIQGLRARVASWSVHSGLNWGTEEISAVTRYLNRRFYQLVP
jgi:mono/diheme cytochrome c family protein